MRLIDADKLEKEMNELCGGECECCVLQDCPVYNQPTAYDVDKAMEKLETKILDRVCIGCAYLKDNICTYKGTNCNVSKPMYKVIKRAFEEVKAGGTN